MKRQYVIWDGDEHKFVADYNNNLTPMLNQALRFTSIIDAVTCADRFMRVEWTLLEILDEYPQ